MYAKFAQWYDSHYRSIKDYDADVERIAYILDKLGTQPRTVLDIACGTGEHARILRETYGYDEERQVRVLQARQGSTDGKVSVLTIDYDIETPDESLSFSEIHRLGLFTREEIESALNKHRFESSYLASGVLNGLLHLACYTS